MYLNLPPPPEYQRIRDHILIRDSAPHLSLKPEKQENHPDERQLTNLLLIPDTWKQEQC